MSISTYVGFFRNLLCCVKDLQLFSSVLSLPLVSTPLSSLPPFSLFTFFVPYIPSDLYDAFLLTTVLEICIFPLQVYAFYSLTTGGFNGLKGTLQKLGSMKDWSEALDKVKKQVYADYGLSSATSVSSSSGPSSPVRRSTRKKTPSKPKSSTSPYPAAAIVCSLTFLETSMGEHKAKLNRDLVESCACLVIGPSFIWLAANSLHVTATPYIGGIDGVILALIFMEFALLPLLWYMKEDAVKERGDGKGMMLLADKCWDGEFKFGEEKEVFEYVSAAVSVRAETVGSADDDKTPKKKERDQEDEVLYDKGLWEGFGKDSGCNDVLYPWFGKETSPSSDVVLEAFHTVASGVDAMSTSGGLVLDAAPLVQGGGERRHLEGLRCWLYVLLNFVAFYGYALSIIVYYLPAGSSAVADALKFGMVDGDADWWGNFAGDLCWTVEPAVIIWGGIGLDMVLKAGGGKAKVD